jgi:hypothetical protein
MENILEKSFLNSLHFLLDLWHSIVCVGERPMKYTTHNSLRRLEQLDPSCTGIGALSVNFQ